MYESEFLRMQIRIENKLRSVARLWSRRGLAPDSGDINHLIISYAQLDLIELNLSNAE